MTAFELVVIRHGIAAQMAPTDLERPLTTEGVHLFSLAARGLASLLAAPVEIFSSPYLRACQTAEILCNSLKTKGIAHTYGMALDFLTPESPIDEALDRVKGLNWQGYTGTLVYVTHQPLAGNLVGALIAGANRSFHLEPGESCALKITKNAAFLDWKLPSYLASRLVDSP